MRDVAATLQAWTDGGHRFAVATVIQTWGSSPRPVGAKLAVREDGAMVGSVSGGCVDGVVIEAAHRVLQSGRPERLDFDSIPEDEVWRAGLSCGGAISIWIEPSGHLSEASNGAGLWPEILRWVAKDEPFVVVRHLDADQPNWTISSTDDPTLESHLSDIDGKPVFVDAFHRRHRLVLVGASHIAIHLVRFARDLDFEVVLIDPRSGLLQPDRFPTAPDLVLDAWPEAALAELRIGARDFGVTLSHDPKIDDPAIEAFLRGGARYVGCLGSRKTHAARIARLAEKGFATADIERVRGPVGLNIGAKSPAEIALAIAAEMVQTLHA